MNTSRRYYSLQLLKAFYLGLLVLSFGLATALLYSRGHGASSLSAFLSMKIKLVNFLVFVVVMAAWHLELSLCGFYKSTRLATQLTLAADAAKVTTYATLLLLALARLFKISMVIPRFLLLFWLLSTGVIILARLAVRYLLRRIRLHGHNLRHVLILGTNARATKFARAIEGKPELGYRVLGFVDDDWSGHQEFLQTGYPLCCDLQGLPEYLRRNVVDEVMIYLPFRTFYEQTSQVAALCEQHGIILRLAADIFDLKIARSYVDDLDGNSHITAQAGSLNGWAIVMKRVLDIVISAVLLVLLTPLLAVVAFLVRFTSEGPVLYRQERVGLNKRKFMIYKFRSMVANADKLLPKLEMLNEVAGPVFKIKNDPRMTPVGRLLRQSSIDELPQLLNVLRGDMSLVGPRPLPVRDYEGFSEDWQRRRFSIRPGITCLWQVSGRSSISFERWMQLDLQYIDQWSLWLDLKILAMTVPAVLKGLGAV